MIDGLEEASKNFVKPLIRNNNPAIVKNKNDRYHLTNIYKKIYHVSNGANLMQQNTGNDNKKEMGHKRFNKQTLSSSSTTSLLSSSKNLATIKNFTGNKNKFLNNNNNCDNYYYNNNGNKRLASMKKRSLNTMFNNTGNVAVNKTSDLNCTDCAYLFDGNKIICTDKCSSCKYKYSIEVKKTKLANNEIDQIIYPSVFQENDYKLSVNQFIDAEIKFNEDIINVVPLSEKNKKNNENKMEDNSNLNGDNSQEQEMDLNNPIENSIENDNELIDNDKNLQNNDNEKEKEHIELDSESEISISTDDRDSIISFELNDQLIKKIKCLITSFLTIQISKKIINSKHYTEDRLSKIINFRDLGFQNFDGNNIGLYKNIGYINRNRPKFMQPSKDLLKLLINLNCNENVENKPEKHPTKRNDLDLSDYYNQLNPELCSYSKKCFYNILELMEQKKVLEKISLNESFLYPDCEYSTDEEDSVIDDKDISTIDENNNNNNIITDSCSSCSDTPFDGPIKIKISKDILNDKLISALKRRTNQRISRNKNTKLHSMNSGGVNSLKFDSYFITQVSFGGPI